MSARRAAAAIVWLAVAGISLLSSVYCLLVYIPFTYQEAIRSELIPLLVWFARVHPLLRYVHPGESAFLCSLAALLPLLAWAALDIVRHGRRACRAARQPGEDGRIFEACLLSALFLGCVYTTAAWCRSGSFAPAAVAASFVSHLMVFLAVFAVLVLAGAVAGKAWVEFSVIEMLAGAAVFLIVGHVVLPQFSMPAARANIYSAVFGVTLAASAAGWSLRISGCPGMSALDVVFAPLGWLRRLKWSGPFLLGAAAVAMQVTSASMDWNFLAQKISAALAWVLTFACFYGLAPGRAVLSGRTLPMLGACLAALGAYHFLGRGPHEAYAGFDPSFRLIRDTVGIGTEGSPFYGYLTASTNIPHSHKIAPVDVLPVASLSPRGAGAQRPNIFVFVIDSLRQDYLSPYNRKVTFTPAIDAFARESTVFPHAFTRYGATGLSEPALWAGSMLLHQQYVLPFRPMNALEKLLDAEGYRKWVSMDSILRVILSPDPALIELDRGRPSMNIEFAQTLAELRARLSRESAGPLFVYTQPQNIHVSVIQRENASVPAGEAYPGFYAPYASRLKRMDAAFGDFIAFLKARGLFDDSLIVLTADHGDSLGEEGRWGHAYTLFPEIVRIPLLVHLPRAFQTFVHDPQHPAFLTDIVPSLYYLLGHRPIRTGPTGGRPLFTETLAEQRPYFRDSYMMCSSYAAVYGLLERNGTQLYIADAVNFQAWSFDAVTGRRTDTGRLEDQERRIRHEVETINRFYRFDPEPLMR